MGPKTLNRTAAFILLALFACLSQAFSQKIGNGLWNSGRSFAPRLSSDSLKVWKLLARVQLYPGFSVVRTDLDILNPGKDSLGSSLVFVDSATTSHPYFSQVSNLPPASRLVIRGKDTLSPSASIVFAPGLNPVSVLEITPDHQAILSRDGSVKEGNAFVYSPGPKTLSVSRILVEFRAGLTMTNIMGVYPASALGTMSQLSYNPIEEDLIVWYSGAPPDMKMEKKVLPLRQQLFAEMDSFDSSMFRSPEFKPVQQKDFSTNQRSPFVSFLYFIMFSAPWVLLVAFLAWLAFKPKNKKKNA